MAVSLLTSRHLGIDRPIPGAESRADLQGSPQQPPQQPPKPPTHLEAGACTRPSTTRRRFHPPTALSVPLCPGLGPCPHPRRRRRLRLRPGEGAAKKPFLTEQAVDGACREHVIVRIVAGRPAGSPHVRQATRKGQAAGWLLFSGSERGGTWDERGRRQSADDAELQGSSGLQAEETERVRCAISLSLISHHLCRVCPSSPPPPCIRGCRCKLQGAPGRL